MTPTDHLDDEPTPEELATIEALLANEAVWAEPPADLEDQIVAAIAEEARSGPTAAPSPPVAPATPTEAPSNVIPLRRRFLPAVGAAAAVVLAVVGLVAFRGGGDDGPEGIELALAATDLAPGATGSADVITTPAGVKILLDVSGLPPAEPGTFYQAWVRNADGGVSAGTFHLRGGDAEIELWSGVATEDYPVFTVTLQREGEGPASSGMVVLRGELPTD